MIATDPLLVTGNPVGMLAPVNYLLFVLLIATILWLIRTKVRRCDGQRKLVVATATFSGLEVVRWCFMTANLASEAYDRTFFSDPLTYIVLLAMACPLAIAIRASWKTNGRRADGSMHRA
jgi:hypothetical protein